MKKDNHPFRRFFKPENEAPEPELEKNTRQQSRRRADQDAPRADEPRREWKRRDDRSPRGDRPPQRYSPRPDAFAKNLHTEENKAEGIRLNKYVANAGVCSRRSADELIAQGKVTVNDKVVTEMGYRVKRGEVVKYEGKVVDPNIKTVYILMNKPKNTITTASDPQGRLTVLDMVRGFTDQRVYPVGRLDRDTTGLLLLTNDGELAKRLTHPSYRVAKIYKATLTKPLSPEDMEKIATGVELVDGVAKVDWIHYVEGSDGSEVQLEIHIGKNRIVRRIFEQLNYQVLKLDRMYFAGLTKKDLPRGKFRMLNAQEVIMLKHFVGKA